MGEASPIKLWDERSSEEVRPDVSPTRNVGAKESHRSTDPSVIYCPRQSPESDPTKANPVDLYLPSDWVKAKRAEFRASQT